MQDKELWITKYEAAYKFLDEKFSVLCEEFSKNSETNPIEHIKSRIKSPYSIKEKIVKKIKSDSNIIIDVDDIVLDDEIIDKYLNDVVGFRIICSFKSDLVKLIDLIRNDSDLVLIDEKNYIANPKENGYKSYHMRVLVPVYVNGEKKYVKAEIQLRTIAMDMSASLEHIIYYKKNIDLPDKMMQDMDRTVSICDDFDNMFNNYINYIKDRHLEKGDIDLNSIPIEDFNRVILKYEIALNNVKERINLIKEDCNNHGIVNLIEHVNSRIKNRDRIIRKLNKQGKSPNIENMESAISDIAAIRVVCPFKKNIYDVVDRIREFPDIKIIREKDYITNPKDSGYRSYHLIAEVPVRINNKDIEYVKVEIQVRSMAMDMWASLQRKLCYQNDDYPEIKEELKRYSNLLAYVDESMDNTSAKSQQLINMSNPLMVKEETKKLVLRRNYSI